MTVAKLEGLNLRKSHGKTLLWQIDTLQLNAGESIHLRGENGSGKTTLLKILAGLQLPDRGLVRVNNQPVRLGKQVCYLHQHPFMFDRSVKHNMSLVLSNTPRSIDHTAHLLEEALEWSGLALQADQPARTLSGGERQALAMARAWLCQPTFWLLDEPMASLDEKGVKKCVDLVMRLREAGAAILLTTHQTSALTEMCDQQWQLVDGQLIH